MKCGPKGRTRPLGAVRPPLTLGTRLGTRRGAAFKTTRGRHERFPADRQKRDAICGDGTGLMAAAMAAAVPAAYP